MHITGAHAAKERHGAVRPVQLIEIDIIRLQIFKTALHGEFDLIWREARLTAFRAHIGGGRASGDFRGENDFVPHFA